MQDVTDEAVLMGLLEANDCVCTSLMKYESVALAGPQSGGDWLADSFGVVLV